MQARKYKIVNRSKGPLKLSGVKGQNSFCKKQEKSLAAESIRLQVFLSRSGICSRRKAMDIIKEGFVTVNKRTVYEPSTSVCPGRDEVCVKGRKIIEKKYEYILLNKPAGYISTKADRFAKKKVIDLLPQNLKHLHPVGRLDKETEGLLILTNDGDLTHQLTHPKFNVEKVYIVRIKGQLTQLAKNRLEKGILLEHRKTAPAKVSKIRNFHFLTEFEMLIHEGRKRQIRLMLEKVGYPVVYLKRIKQGSLTIGVLTPGQYRKLNKKEILELKHEGNRTQ